MESELKTIVIYLKSGKKYITKASEEVLYNPDFLTTNDLLYFPFEENNSTLIVPTNNVDYIEVLDDGN